MSDLGERLERLGLSQYLEVLLAEGFDSWETVLDITESDLNLLNVKLGHRRKLQRAIAESRGQSGDRPLIIKNTSGDGSYRSDDSGQDIKSRAAEQPTPGAPGTSTKRKYRRHPKADENAPDRPPSAYVIFSNQVRETLKGQDLSFTEIAKVVGERWQVLPADARESCERQANAAKEKYYAELAEYKKTPEYEAYQSYLEDFKAKHAAPQRAVEGKRSKLETETSVSTSGSWNRSDEQIDRPGSRRVSSVQPDALSVGHHRTEASPSIGPARLSSGPAYPHSTSPAVYPRSVINSPRMSDHYSPTASPRSATLHKENSFDMPSSAFARDARAFARDARVSGHEARGHSEPRVPHPSNTYGSTSQNPLSTTPPAPYAQQYQAPIELPSRRSQREPTRLPPLTHEDTTLSSNSGESAYGATPYPHQLAPLIDPPKSMRTLPQPVPSLVSAPSPLDRPPVLSSPSHLQSDFRTTPSLAALLRAGELAREADDEEQGKVGSP